MGEIQSQSEPSLLDALFVILERKRLLLGLALAGAAAVVAITLVSPSTYTASTLVVPASPSSGGPSQLRGLASQLGLADGLMSSSPTASPAFLKQLTSSSVVLARVLEDSAALSREDPKMVQILEILSPRPFWFTSEEAPREVRMQRATRRLRGLINTSTDRETGSVSVSVTTGWPGVSLRVTELIVRELNRVNVDLARSRALDERRFVESRIITQREAVRAAEGLLARFLDANREYRSSATLVFAHDRLQREVALQQEVLTTLLQSNEDVQIREVKDTPAISVVEPGAYPPTRDARGLIQRALLGFLTGGSLGVLILFVGAALTRRADAGDAAAQRILDAVRARLSARRRQAAK